MQDEKISLSDIRKDLDRRLKTVGDLKARLERLGEEIQELLGDIDGLEGLTPQPKRRGRRKAMALADAIGGTVSADDEAGSEEEAEQGRRAEPDRSDLSEAPEEPAVAVEKPKKKPAPRRREGPSIVDVAETILREAGKPLSHEELARLVEAQGVSSGNTQQVLLLAAGRKTRLVKNQDGLIALSMPARPETAPAPEEAEPPAAQE